MATQNRRAAMQTTFVATAGLETAPLQDGAVLYNMKTGKFVMLNRTAAYLWSELSTPKTENELVGGLGATFSGASLPAVTQSVGQVLKTLQELELVSSKESSNRAGAPAAGSHAKIGQGNDQSVAYEQPSIRVLNEEELLDIFQMTAAEISVASCWWGNCPSVGCP
jgi:hypothetical protein